MKEWQNNMLNDSTVIEKKDLKKEVSMLKTLGYRFASMTCEKEGQGYELIYHFDKNYAMKNLYVYVDGAESIDSISSIYPSAFLIENEYQDLFGFVFDNLTIDYKGRLYLTGEGPETPLAIKNE
jgi:ech hydrogenase subunit D